MPSRFEILRIVATAAIAFVVLWQKLLVPVLLGLLVYAWSCLLADRLWGRFKTDGRGIAALSGAIVGIMVIAAVAGLAIWTTRLATIQDLHIFLYRIEGSLELLRRSLPESLSTALPANLIELRASVFAWLRVHAASIGGLTGTVMHALVQGLFAVLVAAMAAAATWRPRTLASEAGYLGRLLIVLERVVLAQLRIALFNTTMTALYLFVILPWFGFVLPFRGLLILFTLLTGVLPVLGNLMANTVVTLLSLAISPLLAISSLMYLVLIHKTEYFINARTVGSRVQVASWEILAAMLTGESLFGVQGLVAAPLLYPFFKREISRMYGFAAARGAAEAAVPAGEPAVAATAVGSADTGEGSGPEVRDTRPRTTPSLLPDAVAAGLTPAAPQPPTGLGAAG
jgi:predicted PurR-regulated permease PerM